MVAAGHITQASSSVLAFLPLFLRAPVVSGMRRGGKELGIPTGIPHVCNFIRFDFVAFHVPCSRLPESWTSGYLFAQLDYSDKKEPASFDFLYLERR